MIGPFGTVSLGGRRFTYDPRVRREWPPRRSRLLGVMGSTTQQAFGRWAKDMRLMLTSEGNFADQSFKAHLDSLLLDRRATYQYSDYQGVEGDVVVVDFAPVPTFYPDRSETEGRLWEYTLVLDVVALRRLDFAAYAGA